MPTGEAHARGHRRHAGEPVVGRREVVQAGRRCGVAPRSTSWRSRAPRRLRAGRRGGVAVECVAPASPSRPSRGVGGGDSPQTTLRRKRFHEPLRASAPTSSGRRSRGDDHPAAATRRRESAARPQPPARLPAYRRLWIGGVASGIGVQLTAVAVGIHVYDISGGTFAVALVGGFALLPMLVVGLLGGVIVDPFDRRATPHPLSIIALARPSASRCSPSPTSSSSPLLPADDGRATAGTIVGTARFAILPRLVPHTSCPRPRPSAASAPGCRLRSAPCSRECSSRSPGTAGPTPSTRSSTRSELPRHRHPAEHPARGRRTATRPCARPRRRALRRHCAPCGSRSACTPS